MDFKIKDVADLLNVSETTVRRWLNAGEIPAYKIQGQYRFSRPEIENWVMKQKLGKEEGHSPFSSNQPAKKKTRPSEASNGSQKFSLFRALHKGDVLHQVPGKSKEEVIRATTKHLSAQHDVEPDFLADLLIERERLQPTSLNHGLAIPHTREFILDERHDVITVVFPEESISYGALDGEPVHTMFFLLAGSDRRHLHLLAKLAHLSGQNSEFKKLLRQKPNKEKLLQFVKDWESQIEDPAEE
jgi:PTS system nitrogen regulatory IIA component